MEKPVLVHLSDIHFAGSSGTSVHDPDAVVRNELACDAPALTKGLGGATACWLLELCRASGCPEESVWVVPGSHDADRRIADTEVTKTLQEGIRSIPALLEDW